MSQTLPNKKYTLASEVLADLQDNIVPQKSKKPLVLIAAVAIPAVIGIKMYAGSGNNLQIYQSKQPIDLKLQYPDNWEKFEATATGELIKLVFPPEDIKDSYREDFKVTVEPLENLKISLQEYSDRTVQQISANLTEREITSIPFAISKLEARKVIYSQDKIDKNLKTMLIFVIKNDRAYIYNYTAEIEDFDRHLPTIDFILGTIVIN
jgi:hypothetical protein